MIVQSEIVNDGDRLYVISRRLTSATKKQPPGLYEPVFEF